MENINSWKSPLNAKFDWNTCPPPPKNFQKNSNNLLWFHISIPLEFGVEIILNNFNQG